MVQRLMTMPGKMEAYRVVDRVLCTGAREVLARHDENEKVIYQKLLDMSYEDMVNGAMERL